MRSFTRFTAGLIPFILTVGCSDGTPSSPTPDVVARVEVTPGAATVQGVQSTQLSVTLRAADGTALVGRPVEWSSQNPNVATVSRTGLVSGVTPGTAVITATSGGQSGSAQIAVEVGVASIVLDGAFRAKVGASYPYSVTVRLTDNSTVAKPVEWRVVESARGVITSGGVLTPSEVGDLTIQATVDGLVLEKVVRAYDWYDWSSDGFVRYSLESDQSITSQNFHTTNPDLVVSCSPAGAFSLEILTDELFVQPGLVSYSLDQGPLIPTLWSGNAPYGTRLSYPGTNGERKAFAQVVAASELMNFTFSEWNSSFKSVEFRVTGLASLLPSLLTACPGT